MLTKNEKNIILLLAALVLAGAGWFLFKKYFQRTEPVRGSDTANRERFDRQAEQKEAIVITPDNPVNINTDGFERIEALPYIGPERAKDIIEYREANGPFNSLDDLTGIKGIGSKTIEKLKVLIRL